MGREASEMSVSPAQKRLKPPPVPETPTCTRTFGATLRNSSATASEMGKTVLEPSMSTSPERLPRSSFGIMASVGAAVGSSPPPQAATTSATAAKSVASIADLLRNSVKAGKLRSFIPCPLLALYAFFHHWRDHGRPGALTLH